MPRYEHECVDCGDIWEERVPAGAHPPCSRCLRPTTYLWRGTLTHGIQTDESFIGGKVIENLGDQPVTVYSRQELAQAMHKAGVEQRIKFVPGDKHLSDWSKAIDPVTLSNAVALVSRVSAIRNDAAPPPLRVETSIRTVLSGA